jgi:predicted DNA-binding transcriptional regulator AlpA
MFLPQRRRARNAEMASAIQFEKRRRELRSAERASGSSPLLTAADVAYITGLSVETLAQWRSQCRGIRFLKISRNVVRYQQSDLDAWLSERIVRVEQDSSNARRNP